MAWESLSHRLGKTEGELSERYRRDREEIETSYVTGESDFLLNALPREVVDLDHPSFIELLQRRFGAVVKEALQPQWCDPGKPSLSAPTEIRGPVAAEPNSQWLTRTNMVGVNVRTLGSFIDVAKYALTVSGVHDSIHLLPIWEPGVVGSLYGISSWKINSEFFDPRLALLFPHLDTPGKQLKATINILHLMGKAVGMDVIPHTDRFSEIVLANPHHFEWLRREDTTIVDHRSDLHQEVQERILDFLSIHGDALSEDVPSTTELERFFLDSNDEERSSILFGPPQDVERRSARRGAIAKHLYRYGYEPVPATMAPPYRGLTVDRETAHIDADGHIWREYLIERPESMSRVFGPLTRYKLYERRNDNADWEIDFERPRRETWRYVQERYAAVQRSFGFDFMRGDMSHVQMRRGGVPFEPGQEYDLLGSIKNSIRNTNTAPYFGYFAETFISPPGVMAYGDEIDHLEASGAEVTLGDLQSRPVESAEFIQQFRWYRDIGRYRRVQPAFTVMTADKDDPRFDRFYNRGNEARYFSALFLADMPSYTGLNFECRDTHDVPAPNEHYTKLYVFQERSGPKATNGPFQFGRNGYLFFRVSRIRLFAEEILPRYRDMDIRWLIPPDATAGRLVVAWTFVEEGACVPGGPICVVNFADEGEINLHVPIPQITAGGGRVPTPRLLFSTDEGRAVGPFGVYAKELPHLGIPGIRAGEALVLSV